MALYLLSFKELTIGHKGRLKMSPVKKRIMSEKQHDDSVRSVYGSVVPLNM